MPLITAHADVPTKAIYRGLNNGLSLHLHPYFVYGSREGSGGSVHADAISNEIFCNGPNIEYTLCI